MGRTDPEVWESVMRSEAVRTFARQRLTEVQYRRLAKLYGFHGPAMSERQVAREEGVYRNAVHQSHAAALEKLSRDARLLLLWFTIYL